MMRGASVIFIAALTLCCEAPESAPSVAPEVSPDQNAGGAGVPPAITAVRQVEVGPEGIGAAQAGMTVAEIRRVLGPDLKLGELNDRFMVDLIAIPVLRGQDTLFYLVFPADESPNEQSVPEMAVTDHPEVRTRERIGPGSTLAEAAATYGSPKLSYSADDEMREYAAFPAYRHSNVAFRVAPGDTVFLAGRYEQEGSYGETADFDPDARIMMVLVGLRRF
jgi:hypothetical protein